MAIIRCEVSIQKESGLSADEVRNVWHFNALDPDAASYDRIHFAINSFYNDVPPNASANVSNMLSPELANGSAKINMYNLADPTPRTPVFGADMIGSYGATPANAPLPDEIACVLSMNGVPASGQNMQRRRGRIYLGPLSSEWLSTDGTGVSRPDPESIDICLRAAWRAFLANPAPPDWGTLLDEVLVVYSRADAAGHPVVGFTMDNAWDVQRRRGVGATIRYTGFD